MKKCTLLILPILAVTLASCDLFNITPAVPDGSTIEIFSQSNNFTMALGEQITLYTKINNKINKGVTWSLVNNNGIVSSDTTGRLFALSVGTVEVHATSNVNASVSTFVNVTVLDTSSAEGGYYKVTNYGNYNSSKLNDARGWNTLGSNGNQKMIVVPVKLSNGPAWTSDKLTRLEKSFFGNSSDTGWESVSSYYKKSSYNQLNITGTVTGVLNIDKTIAGLTALYDGNEANVEYVAKAFYNSNLLTQNELKSFDQNSDGLVDSVVFIYSNNENGEDYWAWVSWFDPSSFSGFAANTVGKPGLRNHMWASYNFLNEGYGSGAGNADAHTFIHETGHILGLDDYYDYDSTASPLGKLDMMDYNILDHCAYSKMAMEWVKPYYIDGTKNSTTITIRSFNETGDYVLINNDWNKHTLDEFLLLELYTPTGLNTKDSSAAYPGNYERGFTIPGVRMLHVDARAGNTSTGVLTDTPTSTPQNYIFASNTPSSSEFRTPATRRDNKLVRIIQATGSKSLLSSANGRATNNDLFVTGSTFNSSSSSYFPNGRFNEGNLVGYSIVFNSVTSLGATITITKI